METICKWFIYQLVLSCSWLLLSQGRQYQGPVLLRSRICKRINLCLIFQLICDHPYHHTINKLRTSCQKNNWSHKHIGFILQITTRNCASNHRKLPETICWCNFVKTGCGENGWSFDAVFQPVLESSEGLSVSICCLLTFFHAPTLLCGFLSCCVVWFYILGVRAGPHRLD